jgi:hypothetical protein
MVELAVTSPLAGQAPAVVLDFADDFSDLHAGYLISARLKAKLLGDEEAGGPPSRDDPRLKTFAPASRRGVLTLNSLLRPGRTQATSPSNQLTGKAPAVDETPLPRR